MPPVSSLLFWLRPLKIHAERGPTGERNIRRPIREDRLFSCLKRVFEKS